MKGIFELFQMHIMLFEADFTFVSFTAPKTEEILKNSKPAIKDSLDFTDDVQMMLLGTLTSLFFTPCAVLYTFYGIHHVQYLDKY